MAFVAWARLLLSGLAVSTVFEASLANAVSMEKTHYDPKNSGDSDDCYRECVAGEAPRVCKYSFYEEIYNGVNDACGNCTSGVKEDCSLEECVPLDGIERPVMSINRMVPGPPIHACVGDTIEVELTMDMVGHGDTMHWHGQRQMATPYMDGVASVTQCPVASGQIFVYRFVAETAGTYFYHSHNGINKVNGAQGRMVFREPIEKDPHASLYDEDLREHEIFLADWMHTDAQYVFPGLRRPFGQQPATILVNGKGNFKQPDGNYTLTPVEEFVVTRGRSYRFRVINGGWGSCPIGLRILDHKMNIIASDAQNLRPRAVDTLYSGSGERYDFILEADQPGDLYWVHTFTAGFCLNNNISVDQVAILRYADAPTNAVVPSDPRPSVLNLPFLGIELNSATCGDRAASLCVSDLHSLKSNTKLLLAKPDKQVVIAVGFHTYTKEELFQSSPDYPKFIKVGSNVAGTLNNIAFKAPASPPLTQPGDSPLCESCPNNATFCSCTHVFRLPKNKIVDIIMVEQTNAPSLNTSILAHPMHLHGYWFLVRGVGSLKHIKDGAERVRYAAANARSLVTNSLAPPSKDTVLLPGGGYAVVRLYTDNPGMWFFHCHFPYHMASGMEGILQVGEYEDFVKPPKNFPKCGNFFPNKNHS